MQSIGAWVLYSTYHVSVANSLHFINVKSLQNWIEKRVQGVEQTDHVHWRAGRRDGRETNYIAKEDGNALVRFRVYMFSPR